MDVSILGVLADAFATALLPTNLLAVCLGVAAGVFLGAIPGLSGTMAIALMIPLTVGVESTKNTRAALHNGLWSLKILGWLGLIVAMFFLLVHNIENRHHFVVNLL